MKRIKRFVCGALASLMFVSVPIGGFAKVEAAEVVFGVTAWDILQTIMLSLGVTVSVQSSDLTSEVCQEIVDTFNLWVQQNGFDDTAQLKEDLTDLLVEGKKNVINISEKTWSALRSWAKALVNGDTTIDSVDKTVNYANYAKHYSYVMQYGDYQYTGNVSLTFDTNIVWGGVLGVSCNGQKLQNVLVYATKPFVVTIHDVAEQVNTRTGKNYGERVYIDESIESTQWANHKLYYYAYSILDGRVGRGEIPNAITTDLQHINRDGVRGIGEAEGRILYDIVDAIDNKTSVQWENVGGQAVETGAWDIITKGRTWDGEAVAGDVNIAIPEDIAGDIINVQEGTATVSDVISIADSVAIPVDTTADKAIDYPMDVTETLDYADTKADDITITDTDTVAPDYDGIKDSETSGKYYVKGLQSVFPFCIPFDVIDFLGCLSAPAQAPHFKIPIKYPTLKGMETYEVDLDLSKFNDVAKIVRTCETLLFCVGLAVVTRNLYIRG